ncbi:ABC-2 type transport system permease protein/oleandomycin transport system permease protein [Saccharomonospora amisosensis]|uniref:Transport permease protein n=1 Tax=Saccharomonospora amisosensis TaxID=1128677 RepID=A0A7X5USR2_9PSEU|nr:ABC transporter permease [Saccharomonospora amisosensis]NIJ13034.1 ABC-2 type transport system permease protein/oleandomycin transport system permease protein [Saccharomonospora amisosensis]
MSAESRTTSGSIATAVAWWWTDAWLLVVRNVRTTLRTPDTIFAMTAMPVLFYVFFGFVLGGTMNIPGEDYTQYLFPGLLVATITFSTVPAVIGAVSADLRNGIMDRFRALPMSRSAVLVGRTAADSVRNLIGIVVLVILGLFTGVDLSTGPGYLLAGLGLLLLYGFAIAWIAAFIAIAMRGAETAQMIGTAVAGPVGFVSSLYANPAAMPAWLGAFAEYNPASHTGNTLRDWLDGTPAGSTLWLAVAWLAGIVLVLGFLAVHQFQRTAVQFTR